MEERLNAAFDVCLSALDTGVPLEQCLSLYPDLAPDLGALLLTVQSARTLGAEKTIPRAAQNRSRAMFLTQAAKKQRQMRFPWLGWAPRLALATLALIFVFAISFNTLAHASAQSLPGDTLYPVKLAAENMRLQLAPNVESKHLLEAETNHRRADEVRQLLNLNRVELVSLEGRLEAITEAGWLVDGILVTVTPDTQQIGNIQLGQVIEVEGRTQPDGRIVANELHLRYFVLAGELQQINTRTWQVAGTELQIDHYTQFSPDLKNGDLALVLVYSSDDGRLYANALTPLPQDALAGLAFTPFEIEFAGTLEAISGQELIVNGKSVVLTPETSLEVDLTTGRRVQVSALVNLDGSLTALLIRDLGNLAADEATMDANRVLRSDDDDQDNGDNTQDTEAPDSGDDDQDSISDDDSDHDNDDADHSDDDPGDDDKGDDDDGGDDSDDGDDDDDGDDSDHNDDDDDDDEGDDDNQNEDQEDQEDDGGDDSPESD